mmetsp:Transcript_8322/g.11240  ORF Transcript_8322/g.11240 Transcript_8322/m.11240 type:complete len:228 (+) Transcript_8322:369-1052(+)
MGHTAWVLSQGMIQLLWKTWLQGNVRTELPMTISLKHTAHSFEPPGTRDHRNDLSTFVFGTSFRTSSGVGCSVRSASSMESVAACARMRSSRLSSSLYSATRPEEPTLCCSPSSELGRNIDRFISSSSGLSASPPNAHALRVCSASSGILPWSTPHSRNSLPHSMQVNTGTSGKSSLTGGGLKVHVHLWQWYTTPPVDAPAPIVLRSQFSNLSKNLTKKVEVTIPLN